VLGDPAVLGGGLTLRFDRRTPALDYLAATSNARARRLHWIFGDQAMFVRRSALEAVGGFPHLPIMEDLELSRRLARTGPLVLLPATSTASARRMGAHGTLRMVVFMQWLKLRYLTGADPAALAAQYRAGPPLLSARLRLRQLSRSTRTTAPPYSTERPGSTESVGIP
jgi:hypothetical protein